MIGTRSPSAEAAATEIVLLHKSALKLLLFVQGELLRECLLEPLPERLHATAT